MGVDNSKISCRFANPPLNVCSGTIEKEGGTEFGRERCCPANYQECDRYKTYSRIMDSLDRKMSAVPARYKSISTRG